MKNKLKSFAKSFGKSGYIAMIIVLCLSQSSALIYDKGSLGLNLVIYDILIIIIFFTLGVILSRKIRGAKWYEG